jgi:tetratricopeptide (TPR) repeat protein
MCTAVWRTLCGPTFNAMHWRVAARLVAVFIAGSGCEAAAQEDLTACFKEVGDAAIAACTAAITSGKYQSADLATAHIIRGNSYFSKGDQDAAARDYEEAIRHNPKNAVAFYNRGNVYNGVGQYGDAIEKYNEAINLKPDYANAFNNRCFAYNGKGEYDQAVKDCDRAIELGRLQQIPPGRVANFFVSRGNAYRKKHDNDQARADYNQAIQLDPDNVSAYLGRGAVFLDKADYRSAIEDCDQALKRQPNNSSAWNNRCWARAILGGPQEQLKQALKDCNEALRLRPNDPYAFDSRGFVYLKLNDFGKAIADYDQSLLLGGERASSLYGRGIAKLRKGDAEAGNKDIAAATKSQPDIAAEFRGYGVQLQANRAE